MDVIKSQQLSVRSIRKVVVHPLVLLSIVDNYYRVAKDTRKRVFGVLLGSSFKGTVDVTNSYVVYFEEDEKDPSIWFIDHNYHEAMFSMFKRINGNGKLAALKGLDARLKEIRGYLDLVIDGKLPLNHEILYHLQDVFNLLPNLNVADLIKAFAGICMNNRG
ncbi:hypothetical protein L2E82_48359 [Cichorium intybus]|uniref:Uncharacterized protein n=1 Tax=Cichorium intybus TaxID=13427 RepID=A0ACB8YY31_CICIN|nr:hypothetical protein L2E82_48359 [Cichorium intybus]